MLAVNMALATGLQASEVAMEMGPQKQALFGSISTSSFLWDQRVTGHHPAAASLQGDPEKLERAEKTPGPQEMLAALLFRCHYLFLSSAHYLESPRLLAL